MIAKTAFINVTDMLGAGAKALADILGDGTQDYTVAAAGEIVKSLIAQTGDPAVIEDLQRAANSTALNLLADPHGYDRMAAISKNLSAHVNGVSPYIASFTGVDEFRACPEFNEVHRSCLGVFITNEQVFSDAIGEYDGFGDPDGDGMAKFSVTGSGAGTLTPGDDIDDEKYNVGHLKVEVTDAAIGAAEITATITLLDIDGVEQEEVVVIPALSVKGAKIDVGAASDKYYSVEDITIVGGTNGDKFRVILERERELPAIEIALI
jgi:hypothetical protein